MSEYTWIGDDKPMPQDERYDPDNDRWYDERAVFMRGWDEGERLEQMQQQSEPPIPLPAEYFKPFYDPEEGPEPQDFLEPGERARYFDRDYMGSGPSPDDGPDPEPYQTSALEAALWNQVMKVTDGNIYDVRLFGYEPGSTMRRHHDDIRNGGKRHPKAYAHIRQRERDRTHGMESIYRAVGINTRRERSRVREMLRKGGWI